MAGEGDRVRQCRASGRRDDVRRGDAGGEEPFESGRAFGDTERLALSGGAERSDAVDSIGDKPPGVLGEAGAVDIAARIEGSKRRAPDTAQRGGMVQGDGVSERSG